MQRSKSKHILHIHIYAFVQFCLDTRKVAVYGSSVNRISEGGCGHQRGECEC